MPSATLTHAVLDEATLRRAVEQPGAGAVVVFVGTVRNQHAGAPVDGLEYSAQETLALKELEKICTEACARFQLADARVQHRLGALKIGEASVVIAVSSAHRADAFDGCRYIIDELKTRVPIWKKESYTDGRAAAWVGPDGKPVPV